MNSDKKLTKEDTWRPADLRRHLREEGHGDDYVRRRDDGERKQHRGGESTDRRRRDVEKESRQERDTDGRDRQRETDRLKEGSRDRRGDKDRESEKRRERDRLVEGKRHDVDYTGDRRRDRNREEKHDRERDKERHRDKDKERDRDSRIKVDMDKKRDEKDKERRRDDRERESRRHEGKGEGERDRTEKHDREKRDVKDKDRRERQGEREHKEEPRRHKDERERRPKDRGYQDEKQKPVSEVRERRASKGSGEGGTRRHGDRERTERDKLKERTHREEEKKPELNHHRDATGSKKSTADKRNDVKSEVKDEAEQEYEEDFEDYEEDFEELDEGADEDEEEREPLHQEVEEEREEISPQRRKEIEAVQRAMEEENQRVGTAQSRQSTDREEGERPKWSRGSEINPSRASQRRKINFVAAKQREVNKKVAAKQKKRSTELLHMIDLDFSMTFSLLDLPPVNEYDMYIRTFGTANSKQAYVQCNEDNTDRDIQTEEIEVCEKWTQHPPEHNGACGDPNISQEARDKTVREINFDSQRFTAFLHKASQVMVVLLEEDQAETKSLRKMKSQTDTLSFSDGSLQLNTKLPFLYGRHISMVHFSQVQRHTMMSVHSPTTKPSAVRLDSCTIICIWNIWEPSRPQKVLVYESEVQCCCFSPGKAILVFAGTSVGSVVLWDLREHASNHHRLKIGEDEWTFRQPTFSTDAVMGGSGHFSSVTSVEVVPSAVSEGLGPEVPLLASEEESSGLSFQLASLDENGVLNFWVVVELPKANEAGSPTDLGLRPGGKIKLLHSSSLPTAERVSPRDAVKTGPLQTLHLKFRPTDSNHFFIGTNMGLVNHGTSHGLKAPPKFYRFQETGVRPVDVSSIHFSPFMQHLFLVGCGDGSIRLHAVSHEQPVAEWKNGTAGEAVVSVQWAQTRATVFYVLDAASNLHIWDLMKDDAQPVVTERIHSDRVTATTVFGDSGQQNTYSGIALAHESGKIEMQYFTRHFTVPVSAEEEKLESMTTEAF